MHRVMQRGGEAAALELVEGGAESMAPVAPSGWPRAIAPPLTLTRSGSIRAARMVWSGHAGEGLVDLPQVDVGGGHAGLLQALCGGRRGAVSMITGSAPTVAMAAHAGAGLQAVCLRT
jgi:hypothetical protein